MRYILLFVLFGAFTFSGYGQIMSGKSKTKKVTVIKPSNEAMTKIPDLIITGEKFVDENNNNFINASEKCSISLNVENIGNGAAKNVKVKVKLTKDIRGLYTQETISLYDIEPNETKEVIIPLKSELYLENGEAEFLIEVMEERGFDAFPLEMKVKTKEFSKPQLIIADAAFSTEDGGLIKLNYPINLKVIVQNVGEGDARRVRASFALPNAYCIFLGEEKEFDLGNMGRGETKELEFLFTATRRYALAEIPVNIALTESTSIYNEDTTLMVYLDEQLRAKNEVVISGIETASADIEIASLTSEVDKNIPINLTKYPYRYALIIGNEDYVKYQRGLSTETNVMYARNDATIFRDYAIKTLGVNEMNTFLLLDATAGAISQKLDLLSKLASKTGKQSEIIFYYAGHGLPDQITREPYIIPVDVSGANLSSAIKLQEIYHKLASSGAGKVTVFLDACFSGGAREAGLLASRAVKIKPKGNEIAGNLVVFSAGSDEQSALPYEEKQHGMFTYYLLKKLQVSNGKVTYQELADFLIKNVSIESLRVNQKEQDPTLLVSPTIDAGWQAWRFVE